MRPGSLSLLATLIILFALHTQVRALTYLESLAERRQQVPSRAVSPTSIPAHNLLARQSTSNLANLYICQTIPVIAPLNETTCRNTTTSSGGGLLGGVGTLVTQLLCSPVTRNVTIIDSSCICASAGQITPVTRQSLDTFIRNPVNNATDSPIHQLTSFRNGAVAYTNDTLLSYLSGSLPQVLSTKTTTCKYPTGAIPYCSAAECSYDCPANTSLCGNTCLDNSRRCVSNAPARRALRDMDQVELDLRCPAGKTACALPQAVHGGSVFIADRIECLDTMGDIESCGGCAFPLPGRKSGADCTAIPHAGQVSCIMGTCAVHSCQPGYILDGTDCIPNPNRRYTRNYQAPSQSVIYGGRATSLSSGTLELETTPDTLPLDPLSHADLTVDAKERKAAGKRLLAQRQLTTKQLLERRLKRGKRTSRWAVIFD